MTKHSATLVLTLAIATVIGAVGSAIAAQEVPDPPVGEAPQTVLALLDYNRNLCDRVAGKVVQRWQNLGEDPGAVETIRQYLVDEETSELAAGQAAADTVRRFMRQVRAETSPTTVGYLERIAELNNDLCEIVAYPLPPRQSFEDRLANILDRIEEERVDLGSRLVVTDEQLRALLSPYLEPIQLAGIEAHDEYLDYIESIKPKPKGPTLEDFVRAWHHRYSEATRPTKMALGQFLQARQRNDARAIRETCRQITAAVIPLLRDESVFKIPTQQLPESKGIKPELMPSLHNAYREIRQLAVHCGAGRQREVGEHFAEMQKLLQEAAVQLEPYSLTP